MAIPPKVIYQYKAIPIHTLPGFCGNQQDVYKMCVKMQKAKNSQVILEEKNDVGKLALVDIKSFSEVIII